MDTRSIFTSIGVCLFWIVWAPCAFIKDALQLLFVPFDTQRLVNTYIQTIHNARAIGSVWDPTSDQPEQPQPEFRKIGFEGIPDPEPTNPINPTNPTNPTNNPDEYDNRLT